MASSRFVDLRLLGDKKLERKFRSLETKMQKKIARRAMRDAWKVVKNRAKSNALAIAKRPESEGVMRKVARFLKVRAVAKSRLVKGKRKAIRGRRSMLGFEFRTPTKKEMGMDKDSKWYPPAHIELGSRSTKRGRPAQPAMSYMRKAFREKESWARNRIRRLIWQGVLKEARRG